MAKTETGACNAHATNDFQNKMIAELSMVHPMSASQPCYSFPLPLLPGAAAQISTTVRSEEHTSELQSRGHLVCRLLLEKKKRKAGLGLLGTIVVDTNAVACVQSTAVALDAVSAFI